MRIRTLSAVLFALFVAAPASAQAAVPHVVQPGETLWSIAAANNLTTRTVAAFNGLSENSQVVLGSTIMVPSHGRGLRRAAEGRARRRPRRRRRPRPPPRRPRRRAAAAPPALGGYTVRPGDTLSGLAADARACRVDAIAADERARPERRCCSPAR